jgi:2-keto-4-pentenoate hydratase
MNSSPRQSQVEALARELFAAYQTGQMVPVPPCAHPGVDFNFAYDVASLLKKWREEQGNRAVGRKVGFANRATWRALDLETLVWSHMYDDTVRYAKNNFAAVRIQKARALKVEPEIVFGLKHSIPPGADAATALAATDWLALGFEIIDCPFPDWKFTPIDFVASFGLHAGLVVGEKIQVTPESTPKLLVELSQFKLRVSKNGEFVEEGSGKNSLNSPAACVAELAAAIAQRFPAEPLGATELISSGTLTRGHRAGSGDAWTAEVGGIALPALTLRLD